jgi:hypothetical protein
MLLSHDLCYVKKVRAAAFFELIFVSRAFVVWKCKEQGELIQLMAFCFSLLLVVCK